MKRSQLCAASRLQFPIKAGNLLTGAGVQRLNLVDGYHDCYLYDVDVDIWWFHDETLKAIDMIMSRWQARSLWPFLQNDDALVSTARWHSTQMTWAWCCSPSCCSTSTSSPRPTLVLLPPHRSPESVFGHFYQVFFLRTSRFLDETSGLVIYLCRTVVGAHWLQFIDHFLQWNNQLNEYFDEGGKKIYMKMV